jgi:hypothetical protein
MGEKSAYSLEKTIEFPPILPIGVINRTFLKILPMQNPPKNLLEQVKDQIGLRHYSYRTEDSYVQ